jgi:hypothetical protein
MTDLRVEPLSTDDAAAAGAVLSASHHNYPAFRVEFPDPRVRHRVLLPFQIAAARDGAVYGSLLGASLDDDLLGVALWQPPGRFPLSALRKARMTPALLRVVLAAPRTFPLFARSGAAYERAFPEEPVWYLQALGVHPNPSAAASAEHCLPQDSPLSMPTMSPATYTPQTRPTWSTTSGGVSSSPSLAFPLAPAVRPTTE